MSRRALLLAAIAAAGGSAPVPFDTGWLTFDTAESGSGGGDHSGNIWGDTSNCLTDDTDATSPTASIQDGKNTDDLILKRDFATGDDVPAGATIDQIDIRIRALGASFGDDDIEDRYVELRNADNADNGDNGDLTAVDKAQAGKWPDSISGPETRTYTWNSSDLSTAGVTAAKIRSGYFGFLFNITNNGGAGDRLNVEYVEIRIQGEA